MPLRKYVLISLIEKTKTSNFLDPSWLHSSWKESVYSPSSIHFLQFSLESILLRLLSPPIHWNTLVQLTSNLLIAKSNDQFSTHILPNLPAAFDKADYSCFPETLGLLSDYNIPILTFWPVSQSPLSNLPISNVAVVPGSPFFYLLSLHCWSQISSEF